MTHVEMPGLLVAKRPAEAIETPVPPAVPAVESSSRRSDGSALLLLAAVGLALAVTGGATLSGLATGALQAAVRSTGFGQGETLESEQRRQARSVASLEARLAQLSDQIGGLARHSAAAAATGEARAQEQLARLESEIAALRTELQIQRSAVAQTVAPDGPADPHATALAQAGIGLAALRSSFDERDRARGEQIAAVARRIDRLEQMMIAPEATGSIRPQAAPAAAVRKRGAARGLQAQWSVRPDMLGVAVVNDRGQRFAVTRGAQVPGLGRITDVRRQAGRWVVVTRHGLLVER